MYKRLRGRFEIKWNVKDEYGKQAIGEVMNISTLEINEDNYIDVSNEEAREIQERYSELIASQEE